MIFSSLLPQSLFVDGKHRRYYSLYLPCLNYYLFATQINMKSVLVDLTLRGKYFLLIWHFFADASRRWSEVRQVRQVSLF